MNDIQYGQKKKYSNLLCSQKFPGSANHRSNRPKSQNALRQQRLLYCSGTKLTINILLSSRPAYQRQSAHPIEQTRQLATAAVPLPR